MSGGRGMHCMDKIGAYVFRVCTYPAYAAEESEEYYDNEGEALAEFNSRCGTHLKKPRAKIVLFRGDKQ